MSKRMRRLVSGQIVTDSDEIVRIDITSRCPRKWAFVDMETGDIWVHASRYPKNKRCLETFKRVDARALQCLRIIALWTNNQSKD